MRRNLYPGRCCGCRRTVPAGCGRLGRLRGRWAVVCESCGLILESRRREDGNCTGENEKRGATDTAMGCVVGGAAVGAGHNGRIGTGFADSERGGMIRHKGE